MRCIAILLLSGLASGMAAAVAPGAEPEPRWQRVLDQAPWRPRDSQGELVFRDQLWILGGWFDSFQPAPRDVWSTGDGTTWREVTPEAPWRHSDLPMSLVFNDRMWMLGGWYNGRLPDHEAGNEVWSSGDGANWALATKQAGWSPRLAAAAVVFRGKMWILGGSENYYFGDEHSLKNDVWSSADGVHWTCETAHAPWAPRAYHQAVVLGDTLYVLGGGNYVPTYQAYHDVWRSTDGIHWEQVTAAAPWEPRLWFSAVTYRQRMWVLGGWSGEPSRNHGDLWHSADGATWQKFASPDAWKARHEHSAVVWRDRIWVLAGHAMPLTNDVWSLFVPVDWFETQASAPEQTPGS